MMDRKIASAEKKLGELRYHLEAMFYWMDEVGASLHPLWVDHVRAMAEILNVDPNTVPLEDRQFPPPPPVRDR